LIDGEKEDREKLTAIADPWARYGYRRKDILDYGESNRDEAAYEHRVTRVAEKDEFSLGVHPRPQWRPVHKFPVQGGRNKSK
jgi:hypothetical protein